MMVAEELAIDTVCDALDVAHTYIERCSGACTRRDTKSLIASALKLSRIASFTAKVFDARACGIATDWAEIGEEIATLRQFTMELLGEVAGLVNPPEAPVTRERLPDRRPAMTFDFAHTYPGASERMFTASVGFHADGRVGELFVHAVDGASRNVNVDVHDAAISLSFALQHGADLAAIGRAMLRAEDGKPHGFMGAMIDAALALIDGGAGR